MGIGIIFFVSFLRMLRKYAIDVGCLDGGYPLHAVVAHALLWRAASMYLVENATCHSGGLFLPKLPQTWYHLQPHWFEGKSYVQTDSNLYLLLLICSPSNCIQVTHFDGLHPDVRVTRSLLVSKFKISFTHVFCLARFAGISCQASPQWGDGICRAWFYNDLLQVATGVYKALRSAFIPALASWQSWPFQGCHACIFGFTSVGITCCTHMFDSSSLLIELLIFYCLRGDDFGIVFFTTCCWGHNHKLGPPHSHKGVPSRVSEIASRAQGLLSCPSSVSGRWEKLQPMLSPRSAFAAGVEELT